jgi:hypothetical protein
VKRFGALVLVKRHENVLPGCGLEHELTVDDHLDCHWLDPTLRG